MKDRDSRLGVQWRYQHRADDERSAYSLTPLMLMPTTLIKTAKSIFLDTLLHLNVAEAMHARVKCPDETFQVGEFVYDLTKFHQGCGDLHRQSRSPNDGFAFVCT
jgi:hypothetical protein